MDKINKSKDCLSKEQRLNSGIPFSSKLMRGKTQKISENLDNKKFLPKNSTPL